MASSSTEKFMYHDFNQPSSLKKAWFHLRDHVIPHERNGYLPHLLHDRSLSLLAVLLVTVKFTAIFFTIYAPATDAFSLAITKENVFTLTNQSRNDNSLTSLKYNDLLGKAAQAKAEDMLKRQYFSHNTPTGETPWTFFDAVGYNYIVAGENLAVDFIQAETMEDAWMNSPGHRANILNKNYEELGIGVSSGDYKGHKAIFVVQLFGTQMPQEYKAKNEPTKVSAKTTGTKKSSQVKGEALVPEVTGMDFSLQGNQIVISAELNVAAAKVVGVFSGGSVMFEPKPENIWKATLPLEKLPESKELTLQAYTADQKVLVSKVATFSSDVIANYHPEHDKSQKLITLGKITINPKQAEYIFFGLFIAIFIGVLAIKIGVKRHIQHIGTIANASALIIFATILWQWF